jgi:nitrogen fixation/metabolism regulation signal transduction histidine kinase
MTGSQTGSFVLILIFAVFLAIVLCVSPQKKTSSKTFATIIAYSCLVMAFGLVTACLTGKDCMRVITQEDAGGFGRAYSAGLVLFLAGMLFGAKQVVSRLFRK